MYGPVYAVRFESRTVALCGAIDWAAPRFIPPIDRPAAIPAGAGSAILNVLATLASGLLRYRGPYNTAALFDALLHSFTAARGARQRFIADVETRALAGTMDVIDVPFTPAPHTWSWPRDGVCIERRNGVQRVFVGNRAFSPDAHRRLTRADDGWTADVVIAGEVWCPVLTLDSAGELVDGPLPIPAVQSGLLGAPLPPEIAAVLGEVMASRAPRLLAPAMQRVLENRTVQWADTADALATADRDHLNVHAILGERLLGKNAGEILALLVDALEPLVRRLAQQSLAAAAERLP